MTFAAKFGALFLAPFMAFSAFFGMGHHATSTPPTASSTAPVATSSPIHWPGSNGGVKTSPITWRNPGGPMIPASTTPSSGVSITSESPTSGPVGTTVTLTGSGFTSASIVHFSIGAIKTVTVSDNGTKLTFVVPSAIGPYCKPDMACAMYMALISLGTHPLYVENVPATGDATGPVSNKVNFTITSGSTSSSHLSISGLDAPATLAVGSTGTWTVHVTSPSTLQGNLHYSVVWGDEAPVAMAAFRAEDEHDVQTSAVFTHAYETTGTYTPTFTVTDDAGHSVSTSATVEVTPET